MWGSSLWLFSLSSMSSTWLQSRSSSFPLPFSSGTQSISEIFWISADSCRTEDQICLEESTIFRLADRKGNLQYLVFFIEFSLSSVAFWFLQDNDVLAWISAIVLFVSGVIYVVFHCGYAKEFRAQYDKEKDKFYNED